ncbi:MAG: ParA family protein [Acidimicrobiales bacterium]
MRNVTFVMAVTLLKGGVGKTTTSIGLGLALGREPRVGQVLLVDADPQASATASRAALVRRENLRTANLVATRPAGSTPAWATFDEVYPFAQCQLSFPAEGNLSRADVYHQLADITEGHYRPTQIDDRTGPGPERTPSTPVIPNVIIVDTSPAYPGILGGVLDFVAEQDHALLVVPTTMSDLDIPQARQFPEILNRSTANQTPYALLATKFDRRRRTDLERLQALRAAYPVFNTVVPYGLPFARGPFDDHDKPKSPFGRVYKSVTAEAIEMLVGKWQPDVNPAGGEQQAAHA